VLLAEAQATASKPKRGGRWVAACAARIAVLLPTQPGRLEKIAHNACEWRWNFSVQRGFSSRLFVRLHAVFYLYILQGHISSVKGRTRASASCNC
jgi:hypothetical protein